MHQHHHHYFADEKKESLSALRGHTLQPLGPINSTLSVPPIYDHTHSTPLRLPLRRTRACAWEPSPPSTHTHTHTQNPDTTFSAETIQSAETESPWSPSNTVFISHDPSAKMSAAETFGVEEWHYSFFFFGCSGPL